MNCLQNLSISSSLPLRSFKCRQRKPEFQPCKLVIRNFTDLHRRSSVKAVSGSISSVEISGAEVDDAEEKEAKEEKEEKEEKSEIYSQNMTEAMGAVLTYRHELGMNYNFICPDLIVGSCLQTREDVDKLRSIGVKTIFCLQQDPDLEYFGVDIGAIIEYTRTFDDIEHLRAQIRDFDAFDLRLRLPAVVSKLHKAINQNGGVTYIHCTAGLGRAPAVALAYMFWVQGYTLNEALELLLSKRPCFPKIDAIKSSTADILSGFKKKPITLSWEDDQCSIVEVSGLDIGWGQRVLLKFDKERGVWILNKELAEGLYEYKYIIDGQWRCNETEPVTPPNKDGHVNNFIQVDGDDDPSSERAIVRGRLTGDDPELTNEERSKIKQFLEACPDEN